MCKFSDTCAFITKKEMNRAHGNIESWKVTEWKKIKANILTAQYDAQWIFISVVDGLVVIGLCESETDN